MYAAFLPLDQSVSFEKVHGLSCCASPEEGHGEGIVSKGLLSVRISVQSGEASCATPGPKKKYKGKLTLDIYCEETAKDSLGCDDCGHS